MKPIVKLASLVLLASAAFGSGGCSSTKAKVESGPIQARTFRFVESRPMPRSTAVEKRAVVHGMIQDAITQGLNQRGVAPATGEPDVLVAYLVVVGDNTTTVRFDEYFGYGRDASDLQQMAHREYTSTGNPNYFEAGTLLVDLIDARSFKLLWRQHVNRPVIRDLSESARRERIEEAVQEVFKDLRIAR